MSARSLALALTIAAVAATAVTRGQQARDAQGPPRTGTAALVGTVVTDEANPQPVRRAQISLVNADLTVNQSAFTDESGRYQIAGLPAGRYTLSASKPGYLRAAYGAKRYDRPGTTITLKDGEQLAGLTMRMARGGVIAGVIMDENGMPAYGAGIRVMQYRTVSGERTLSPAPVASAMGEATDDRGMYRIFGLPPGEYLVAAVPKFSNQGEIRAMTETEIRAVMQALQQQTQAAAAATTVQGVTPIQPNTPSPPRPDADVVTVGYAAVYFPGTIDAGSAATITLAPGEERSGVDFALQLVRTSKVQGIVSVPPGIAPQSVQLMMTPAQGIVAGGMGLSVLNRAPVDADGTFTYTAVPPGRYTITARASLPAGGRGNAPGAPGAPAAVGQRMMAFRGSGDGEFMVVGGEPGGGGSPYWAVADVTVDGNPVSDVSLSLQPGMTITGRIEYRGTRALPPTDLTRVRLTLTPAPTGGPSIMLSGLPTAQIDPSGRFTITGVTPGRYRIAGITPAAPGSGPGLAWSLKSAVIKGRDVLDFPLDVAPNDAISDALITFSDSTQEVNGSLQDPTGRPAPDYTIVVFAADQAYWTPQSRRIKTTRPSTDGRFAVTNLPPGEYRIAAVVDMAPSDANDPAFLEQLVAASYAFALAEGERKTQDLRISGGL